MKFGEIPVKILVPCQYPTSNTGNKSLGDQTWSGKTPTLNSEVMRQTIGENTATSTRGHRNFIVNRRSTSVQDRKG